MPEPRTAEEQLQQFIEDHERRLRALEAQETYHKALVGLRDNAGAVIDPLPGDYRIQVTDDDIINADRDATGHILELSFDADESGLIPLNGARCQDLIPPLGDFGVCNGQFECGPTDEYPIAMQWVDESVGGTVTRIPSGAAAGYYYLALAGGTGVATIRHDWYIPVHEDRDYYLACHAKGKSPTDTFKFGVHCYDEDKAFIATVWAYNAAPGAAWVPIQRRVGPLGDIALSANTRYIRVVAQAPNVGESLYFDDAQFQQMKAAYSPGIHLVNDYVWATGDETNNTVNYVQHAGSVMTLTFEEPGYLWYSYWWTWWSSVARANWSAYFYIDVDGANFAIMRGGEPAALNRVITSTGMQRWSTLLAAGNHTVSMYYHPAVAGHVITVSELEGSCFYVRAH